MAVLVIADHDNAHVQATTPTRRSPPRWRSPATSTCWSPARASTRPPPQAAKIDGVRKVLRGRERRAGRGHRRGLPGARRAADGELRRGADAGDLAGQELRPAHRRQARRRADLRDHRGGRRLDLRAADLRRQRAGDGEVLGRQEGDHRPRHRSSRPRARAARPRSRRSPRRRAPPHTRFVARSGQVRPARAGRRQDRRLRRPRHGLGRGVPAGDRAAGRQARRRGGRQPRRGRRRLRAERLPGRPDRQGGRAASSTSRSASPAPSSTWPA